MAGPLNAKVVIARCSKSKESFGIRIEQRGKDWVYTWAFPIDEQKAAREGYSALSTTTLSEEGSDYPGCPHCGDKELSLCSCRKIACGGGLKKHGKHMEITCPWCGNTIKVKHVDSINVAGGGY
jgi:predicted RNA-binding Zn-ribbon protein involved in translation (DUF1610 family)